MDGNILLFWKPGPNVKLSAAEVARELLWGEEVEGLIDLPIREILDRLIAAFPRHEEKSGQLICQGTSGSFEATWSWQFVKVELHALADEDRQRLSDTLAEFGCTMFSS